MSARTAMCFYLAFTLIAATACLGAILAAGLNVTHTALHAHRTVPASCQWEYGHAAGQPDHWVRFCQDGRP